MTTPEPSAVRAWARRNGVEVAGRGRLPAEVVDAYTAAQRTGGTAAAPARRASPGRTRSANPAAAMPRPPRPAPAPAPAPAPPTRRRPAKRLRDLPAEPALATAAPTPAPDDTRLAELAADFAALAREFAALRSELAAVTDSVDGLTSRVRELEVGAARPARGRFLRR